MELPALQPRAESARLPLERLAENRQLSDSAKVAQAGRQFEAILLRQILGEAMKPVFKSEFTTNSAQAGIYQDMVVNQLAEQVTASGGLGLASSLQRQLSRQLSAAAQPLSPPTHD